ncbi:glycosyltransferase family 8 protein [Rhexocercosporidium sp. MPI-PUGE-AT-0058]|nr:glycosyltransferase family 8 protein [Rhexocercosporidium sp. MPI-PUGE-AT-0058]
MVDFKILRMTAGTGRVRTRRLLYALLAGVIVYLTVTAVGTSYSLDPKYGLLEALPASPRYAYATLLTSDDERYYTAARILAYQLLVDPETKTSSDIPFVVMVTTSVPKHQRQQLIRDGAIVAHVEDVALPWWIRQRLRRPSRYGDQFIKLRVLQMLEYDRVLYLDVDTLIMKQLDKIFDDPAAKTPLQTKFRRASHFTKAETMLPAQYLFAGRSDNGRSNDGSTGGGYEHPYPPLERNALSGGFWIVAPSNELFNYYMFVMQSSTLGILRPFDPQFMEQAMLNYVHRRQGGNMPWASLNYKWSATFPNELDVAGGVASMHDKFWANGPDVLKERWKNKKAEMELHWPVAGV